MSHGWNRLRLRSSARYARGAVLLGVLAFPSMVLGHRENEYLQAALVVIEPTEVRLQINLAPGIAVADQVIAAIDRDRNGAISEKEAVAYAEFLKRDLTLRVDGRKAELKLAGSEFMGVEELRNGSAMLQIEFSTGFKRLAAGRHRITLENRHLRKISVYLVNAARPRLTTLQITEQKRNPDQSTAEIAFTIE